MEQQRKKIGPLKIPSRNKTIILSILFLILYLSFSYGLYASTLSINLDKCLVKNWGTSSGLPQNSVRVLIQTHEGYIWIGTPAGLVRFDGVRFTTFSRRNSPLKNDSILAIYEDENHVLWVGTDGGGLYSFDDGIWINYSVQEGLSDNHVRVIISDLWGGLWIGTDNGLNHLSADGIQHFTTGDGLYDNIITSLTIDNRGYLWIGTLMGGLARLKEKVIRVYDFANGLSNISVHSLHADHLGNIWIGTLEGLHVLKRGEGTVHPIPGTLFTPVTSILVDEHGILWIGTMADGIKRLDRGTLKGLSTENGLPDDYIHDFLIDQNGQVWIGTNTGGLIQLKEPIVENITRADGLPEDAVYAVLRDQEGFSWVGTRNSGLCRIKNGRITRIIDDKTGLSSNHIRVLYLDKKHSLWIGTEGGGVNIFQKGKTDLLTTKDGLTSNNITAIHQDRTGDVWIGTDKGLNRFSRGKVHKNESTDLLHYHIRTFLESRGGSLYIGTREGLYKIWRQSTKSFNLENVEPDLDVASLYEDEDGVLWVGTNGDGLKRCFEGEITSFTSEDGLIDDYIYSITEDDSARLWMSTNKGIQWISFEQLNDFRNQTTSFLVPAYYDEADGMAASQCIGSGQPSVWKTPSHKLFYPTIKGMAVIDTRDIAEKTGPPVVIIEDAVVDDRSFMSEGEAARIHKSGRLEFRFTALAPLAPEKIRFAYKLEGHDANFTYLKPNTRRTATYLNLGPGHYSFRVKAANNNSIWSALETPFEFEILSPFYKRTIFFVISAVAVLFIGGSGLYFHERKKAKRQRDKYKTSALDPEKADEIVPELLGLMEKEKLFLNPDLTLMELSKKLKIHFNHLSRIINEKFELNYNDFVNRYRIEEAKRLLTDPEQKETTILDIIYSTGFYSKSVFNIAFKKFTGMTPSEFRKKHL